MDNIAKYYQKFNTLLSLSRSNKFDFFISDIKEEIARIKDEELYLVVLGQFKRGKSTLINALIGCDILPTAVLPLTSIITYLKYANEQAIKIYFDNKDELLIPKEELYNYITESGNPSNEKYVKTVEIFYPSEFLKDGIVLIDTPGIGSMFLQNTKSTENFIPKIDAAIFVLSVDPPITETEFKFFGDVLTYVERFFVVMNKTDLIQGSELEDILSYTLKILSNSSRTPNPKIYTLSAKKAIEAKINNDSIKLLSCGIVNLESEIKKSIQTEKSLILQNNLQKKINRFYSGLSFALELELKALKTPVNIFEDKIKKFDLEMDKILIKKKFILYSFNGKVDEMITELEDDIRKFNKIQNPILFNSVSEHLKSLDILSKSNLLSSIQEFFARKLSHNFEEWRIKFESILYQRYLEIVQTSTSDINNLIKKVTDISSGLFNISAPLMLEEITFETPSKFIYRTKDDPLFLEIDMLKILPYFLPRKLVIKMILSKMKKEVEEKIMINAGSISGFYRISISEAVLKFKYEMDEKIDQIIYYINSAIANALQNKRLNENSIISRLNEISKDIALLNTIKLKED